MRDYGVIHSHNLGQPMEHLIFGWGGAPVLVFPTSKGRFFQWEDFQMMEALHEPLHKGWLQLFCVDSVDHLSWYNFEGHQRDQLDWHLAYELFLLEEFLPFVRERNSTPYLIAAGASFGGFHAVNFGLRYPWAVDRVLAMSGDYEAEKYVEGYYDHDVLANSPLDYLASCAAHELDPETRSVEFIVTAGRYDFCLGPSQLLASHFDRLGVPHQLHVWDDPGVHDWPLWRRQARQYLWGT